VAIEVRGFSEHDLLWQPAVSVTVWRL